MKPFKTAYKIVREMIMRSIKDSASGIYPMRLRTMYTETTNLSKGRQHYVSPSVKLSFFLQNIFPLF